MRPEERVLLYFVAMLLVKTLLRTTGEGDSDLTHLLVLIGQASPDAYKAALDIVQNEREGERRLEPPFEQPPDPPFPGPRDHRDDGGAYVTGAVSAPPAIPVAAG